MESSSCVAGTMKEQPFCQLFGGVGTETLDLLLDDRHRFDGSAAATAASVGGGECSSRIRCRNDGIPNNNAASHHHHHPDAIVSALNGIAAANGNNSLPNLTSSWAAATDKKSSVWSPDLVMTSSATRQSTPLPDANSVMSFASSAGGGAPYSVASAPSERAQLISADLLLPSSGRSSTHQLDAKVDMVYSLLAMLGGQEHADMGETLLALSTNPESCHAMRQSGCIPLLVQLVQSDKDSETREKASQALHNLVHSQTDEKLRKREIRIFRLLDQLRGYTDTLLSNQQYHCYLNEKLCIQGATRSSNPTSCELDPLSPTSPIAPELDSHVADFEDSRHPVQIIAHLMKLSFDEAYRQAICHLGGIHTIAHLLEIEHAQHGTNNEDPDCILMRRYACMALTNLTFGDSGNKALLCSFKGFMRALIVQLEHLCDELRQVTASVLRNLSWRADSTSKDILREVNSVRKLMVAAMLPTNKENTLKSILSALWNLSAHCTENKADICAVDHALEFLVGLLTYNGKIDKSQFIAGDCTGSLSLDNSITTSTSSMAAVSASSKSLAIIENAGGILRNISSQIAIRDDYRDILREHNCLPILLEQLKSPSLTVVSNACGTLWNLSAKCRADQDLLWDLGAPQMLRSLNHSKHKMIAMGSSAALKNLLNAKPKYNITNTIDVTAMSMDLPRLPTLGARKQRALMQELDRQVMLTETCDNVDNELVLVRKGEQQDNGNTSSNTATNGCAIKRNVVDERTNADLVVVRSKHKSNQSSSLGRMESTIIGKSKNVSNDVACLEVNTRSSSSDRSSIHQPTPLKVSYSSNTCEYVPLSTSSGIKETRSLGDEKDRCSIDSDTDTTYKATSISSVAFDSMEEVTQSIGTPVGQLALSQTPSTDFDSLEIEKQDLEKEKISNTSRSNRSVTKRCSASRIPGPATPTPKNSYPSTNAVISISRSQNEYDSRSDSGICDDSSMEYHARHTSDGADVASFSKSKRSSASVSSPGSSSSSSSNTHDVARSIKEPKKWADKSGHHHYRLLPPTKCGRDKSIIPSNDGIGSSDEAVIESDIHGLNSTFNVDPKSSKLLPHATKNVVEYGDGLRDLEANANKVQGLNSEHMSSAITGISKSENFRCAPDRTAMTGGTSTTLENHEETTETEQHDHSYNTANDSVGTKTECTDIYLSCIDYHGVDGDAPAPANPIQCSSRMLDPDAMIESLDRFTAELVSSHLQKEAASNRTTSAITDVDTSPTAHSFSAFQNQSGLVADVQDASASRSDDEDDETTMPSLSESIPNVITFTKDDVSSLCHDEVDDDDEAAMDRTISDSTLIAMEATKIATEFNHHANANAKDSDRIGLDLRRSSNAHSLDSVSNLDQINPPSLMLNAEWMDDSLASVASLPDANSCTFTVNSSGGTSAGSGITTFANGKFSSPMFQRRYLEQHCSWINDMDPPSMLHETDRLLNDTPTLDEDNDHFDDLMGTADEILPEDGAATDCHGLPVVIHSDMGSAVGGGTISSPLVERRTPTAGRRHRTARERRQFAQDRYKTYTIASLDAAAMHNAAIDNAYIESGHPTMILERSTVPHANLSRLTPTPTVIQLPSQADTRSVEPSAIASEPQNRSKLSIRKSFLQKRLENKERFRTQTVACTGVTTVQLPGATQQPITHQHQDDDLSNVVESPCNISTIGELVSISKPKIVKPSSNSEPEVSEEDEQKTTTPNLKSVRGRRKPLYSSPAGRATSAPPTKPSTVRSSSVTHRRPQTASTHNSSVTVERQSTFTKPESKSKIPTSMAPSSSTSSATLSVSSSTSSRIPKSQTPHYTTATGTRRNANMLATKSSSMDHRSTLSNGVGGSSCGATPTTTKRPPHALPSLLNRSSSADSGYSSGRPRSSSTANATTVIPANNMNRNQTGQLGGSTPSICKKQVTSKIATLWKRIEDTKKKEVNAKVNDSRVWIGSGAQQFTRTTSLTRSSTFEGSGSATVVLRKKKPTNSINDASTAAGVDQNAANGTKRISRLGSFIIMADTN